MPIWRSTGSRTLSRSALVETPTVSIHVRSIFSLYLPELNTDLLPDTGVDLSDLTGGAYHASDLLDLSGNNAKCWYAQLVEAILPDSAAIPLQQLQPITNLINNSIKPVTNGLNCPTVDKYDQGLFNKFPGYKYSPTGPATNY